MDQPACRHDEDAIKIIGGVSDLDTGQITLLVTFAASTPTGAVLERVRHALDVHARPSLVAWQRRAKAPLN